AEQRIKISRLIGAEATSKLSRLSLASCNNEGVLTDLGIVDPKGVSEEWAAYFRRLGGDFGIQAAEVESISPYLGEAVRVCDNTKLATKRGLALIASGMLLLGPRAVATLAQAELKADGERDIETLLVAVANRIGQRGGTAVARDFFLSIATG